MKEFLSKEFDRARAEVKTMLPNVGSLSPETSSLILKRYSAAIAGNFVNWMAGAAVSCRSVEGRYAAEENVYIEIRDDHSGMLKEFVRESNTQPEIKDYEYVEKIVAEIQKEVSRMNGLTLTTLMGVLENTSAEFIPFLAEVSKKLGNTDLKYTDIHGEADKEHADQFLWALEHEAKHYDSPKEEITKTIDMTLRFLKVIFA